MGDIFWRGGGWETFKVRSDPPPTTKVRWEGKNVQEKQSEDIG